MVDRLSSTRRHLFILLVTASVMAVQPQAFSDTKKGSGGAAPMSELRIDTWTMPGADVGPENPLPPLQVKTRARGPVKSASDVPEEIARNVPYGRLPNPLPYTMQDRYTRQLNKRDFKVAVLENETLRATFLLEVGGRLWSLYHKPSKRELLSVNPVFQPANLAVRNAWFSGGVEWNAGVYGHTPYTCSPMFAGRAAMPDGTPVLRMYEWERVRQVPYQIDAWLPAGSPVLFVRVRIRNPHDREVPMYWWSNIAVPESEDTRVIVPAGAAYAFDFAAGTLKLAPIPILSGTDVSYTTNSGRSGDFFFHIPDGQRRWITALDGKGRGLIQASTDRLKGRKLFYWGRGPGGNRWQEFLSQKGEAYLEIQAGLARTQLEHVPMPAKADWSWLESYGLMEADPKAVHGANWDAARDAVEAKLENLIPRASMDAEYIGSAGVPELPLVELYNRGSGWGALEAMRQRMSGELPVTSPALRFDAASLGEQQAPWAALIKEGAMPEADPDAEPMGYMVQPEWRELLEQSVREGKSAGWNAWLHLGVMRYYADERDGARKAWENSLKAHKTPWALRNLAVLDKEDGDLNKAADRYLDSVRMRPILLPLVIECGKALIEAKRYEDWLALSKDLPESVRNTGRVQLLDGQAALGMKDYARVEKLFRDRFVIDDLREGEVSASNLWLEFHEMKISDAEGVPIDDALRERVKSEYPVPAWIDFRMSVGKR